MMNTGNQRSDNRLRDIRVIIVDDEPDILHGIERLVSSTGAISLTAASGEAAIAYLEREAIDIVISDIKMTGMSGIDLLRHIRGKWPDISVVLITGFGTIEMAVACLQEGAAHFLTKPFDNMDIVHTVERLGHKIIADKTKRGETVAIDDRIIAEDPAMIRVLSVVGQVSATRVPVLIAGESGTGKELIARTIHARGSLRDKPFLAINCAALPDSLLESELFGYKKGAFTGAHRDHRGMFAQADAGTIFLDEIPSMSLAFQGKLLRVLQEKIIRPLGSTSDEEVDFRLICSTNRDLKAMVDRREFREDLYYRLSVFGITLPPLRDRPADIPPLARYFLRHFHPQYLGAGEACPEFSDAALRELSSYAWPGNVRELENVVQRALITCRGRVIQPYHLLPPSMPPGPSSSDAATRSSYEQAKQEALEQFQRGFVQRVLERNHGNISRAAEDCGLTRVALQKLLKKLRIDRSEYLEEQ